MKYFALLFLLFLPLFAHAEAEGEVRARVDHILVDEMQEGQRRLIFSATATDGSVYNVDSAQAYTKDIRYRIREGTRVLLQVTPNQDGTQTVFLIDVVRSHILLWILGLFALITIAVGYLRGALALVGLGVTLAVLFGFVFPRILAGSDPMGITIVGALVILAVNMHLSHGINRKTFTAFASTVFGLGLVFFFAQIFVYFADLSGQASEEAALLFLETDVISFPRGILLAAIILGAVGVLDDITVTQTETVSELREANPGLSKKEVYKRAMNIGRHHIASVVNTLVLAYVGVAMPLFLLFLLREDIGILRFINEEVVAEEIVRTVAGTLALVLLVPIATAAATYLHRPENK